jgi:hypothetical protein
MRNRESHLRVLDSQGNKIPFSMYVPPYEGAATGRRMGTWGMSSSGPNTALYGYPMVSW